MHRQAGGAVCVSFGFVPEWGMADVVGASLAQRKAGAEFPGFLIQFLVAIAHP
jgi:hypothetical protein